MSDKIKVLIVDDSGFMRNLLDRMIKANDKMEVVGKAENGLQAIEMVKSLNPDVVTLDIEMPKMNGIEALKIIMRDSPRPVVMISSLTEKGAKETLEALDLGAVDFIPKALGDSQENIFKRAGYVQNAILAAANSDIAKKRDGQVIVGAKSSKLEPKIHQKTFMPKMNGYIRRAGYKGYPKLLLIGSSTGGPKALAEVIGNLNADIRVPVVVAQHMPVGFTSALAERLNRSFAINVKEASNGDALKPGWVYVAQGGKHLKVEKGISTLVAKVTEDKGESPFKPSVDVLAASVNKAVGADCVAVMLTGMGADGAKEFKNLKEKGAYIITQDENTCTVYGMPKSVVEMGASDEQLPIDKIADTINSMIK